MRWSYDLEGDGSIFMKDIVSLLPVLDTSERGHTPFVIGSSKHNRTRFKIDFTSLSLLLTNVFDAHQPCLPIENQLVQGFRQMLRVG